MNISDNLILKESFVVSRILIVIFCVIFPVKLILSIVITPLEFDDANIVSATPVVPFKKTSIE